MKRTRFIWAIALALALVLMAAGCGSQTPPADRPLPSESQLPPASDPAGEQETGPATDPATETAAEPGTGPAAGPSAEPAGDPAVEPSGSPPAAEPAEPAPAPPGESQTAKAPKLPGDMESLRTALAEPTPVTYSISVVHLPEGMEKDDYLDQLLEARGYPGSNEILLMIFPSDNYNIRFVLGSMLFEKKISLESMLRMVQTQYLPKSRAGDPAGGLADLIRAVNEQVR